MKPVQGEPWPVERSVHAACCLNYGQDHPQLLVYRGMHGGYVQNTPDPKMAGGGVEI